MMSWEIPLGMHCIMYLLSINSFTCTFLWHLTHVFAAYRVLLSYLVALHFAFQAHKNTCRPLLCYSVQTNPIIHCSLEMKWHLMSTQFMLLIDSLHWLCAKNFDRHCCFCWSLWLMSLSFLQELTLELIAHRLLKF